MGFGEDVICVLHKIPVISNMHWMPVAQYNVSYYAIAVWPYRIIASEIGICNRVLIRSNNNNE